ncbi:unnamed protein product [Adineta steineri]|nr:unnamed protein product [Adineta steineri]
MFDNISLKLLLSLCIFLFSIQSILTLRCYECKDCTDVSCPCDNIVEVNANESYCILARENFPNGITVEIKHLPRISATHYEYTPYYMSVGEMITYNTTIDKWSHEAFKIVYACQTDECNRPDLLKELPTNGLSLSLPSDWLNENLLRRADQKLTTCNQCPEVTVCGNKPYFVDPDQCSIQECEHFCIIGEKFTTIEATEYCYTSFCLLSDTQTPLISLNAVYYINNKEFQINETDIICHGVNCSRLEIFQDITEKVQIDYTGIQAFLPPDYVNSTYSTTISTSVLTQISTMFDTSSLKLLLSLCIFLFSIQSILTLRCYECEDCTDVSCPCGNIIEVNANESYCILARENFPDGITVEIKHLPRISANHFEYTPYYISVGEMITYNTTIDKWSHEAFKIVYACQTDECNRPDLLKKLPTNGLSLSLPSDWLNENLLRKTDEKLTNCYVCPAATFCSNKPYFVNPDQCSIQECETCTIEESFQNGETTHYCYTSFCTTTGSQIPSVTIEAVYYLDNKEFRINETDIICHGVNCSRLEIFRDIKEKIQKDYTGIEPFLPGNHVNSIYSTSMSILLMMIFFQNLISY